MKRTTWVVVFAASVLGGARPAAAHRVRGRLELPVSVAAYVAGVVVVLAMIMAVLSVGWVRPRFQGGPLRLRAIGGTIDWILGVTALGGVAAVGLVLVAGIVDLLGLSVVQRPTIAPVLVWVLAAVVMPLASTVLGGVYTGANPWRTLTRWLSLGREPPVPVRTVGLWPAVALLIAFGWLWVVGPARSAGTLALAVGVYTVAVLVAVKTLGIGIGLGTVEFLTPYNRIFSAIAPWGRDRGRIVWRGWFRALPVLPQWPGLWMVTVAVIAIAAAHGLSMTRWWPTGRLAATATFLGVVIAGAGMVWAASVLAGRSWQGALGVAQRFAHTLVPAAASWMLASFVTVGLFDGQQLLSTVSDPFSLGWDLFGTAERKIDYFLRRPEPVWHVQCAALVVGHGMSLVMVHDRILADHSPQARVWVRSSMFGLVSLLAGLGVVILAG